MKIFYHFRKNKIVFPDSHDQSHEKQINFQPFFCRLKVCLSHKSCFSIIKHFQSGFSLNPWVFPHILKILSSDWSIFELRKKLRKSSNWDNLWNWSVISNSTPNTLYQYIAMLYEKCVMQNENIVTKSLFTKKKSLLLFLRLPCLSTFLLCLSSAQRQQHRSFFVWPIGKSCKQNSCNVKR